MAHGMTRAEVSRFGGLIMRLGLTFVIALPVLAAAALVAPDASACGGCFPPPGEQQTVVTDHRMILSLSKDKTPLYAQIQYSGPPWGFAWVPPIMGRVDVGLSSDRLFNAPHTLSAVGVQEPPGNCPPYPSEC